MFSLLSLGKVCFNASWFSFKRASLCEMYRCRLLALYSSSLFSSAWGSSSTPSHLRLSMVRALSSSTLPLIGALPPLFSFVTVSSSNESLSCFLVLRQLPASCSPLVLPVILSLGSWPWEGSKHCGGGEDTGKVSGGKDTTWCFAVGMRNTHLGTWKPRPGFILLMNPSGIVGLMARWAIMSCKRPGSVSGGLLSNVLFSLPGSPIPSPYDPHISVHIVYIEGHFIQTVNVMKHKGQLKKKKV